VPVAAVLGGVDASIVKQVDEHSQQRSMVAIQNHSGVRPDDDDLRV
jgi:hypothetical protein